MTGGEENGGRAVSIRDSAVPDTLITRHVTRRSHKENQGRVRGQRRVRQAQPERAVNARKLDNKKKVDLSVLCPHEEKLFVSLPLCCSFLLFCFIYYRPHQKSVGRQ